MDSNKTASGGIGLSGLLFVIFLVLHLAKVPGPWISGPLWWDGWAFVILAPIAIGWGVTLAIFLVAMLIFAVLAIVEKVKNG